MNPHQHRDQNHWRALGRVDDWSRGWKDFFRGMEKGGQSEDYRRAQVEAMQLAAACAVTPKGPRAT